MEKMNKTINKKRRKTFYMEKMNKTNSLRDIKEPMSSMEDIFEIQEMYDIKSKEKEIEEELKKLGYIS